MIIKFNNSGQVTDIQDNVLVANGTYGNAVISFVADDDIPQETLNKIKTALLSVVRADGLAINDLFVTVGDRKYTVVLQPSWGVLDVPGTIQISCQFILSDGSVLATIAVAGFVQNNIGTLTKKEADDVEERIKNVYFIPMTKNIAEKVDKSSVGQASGVAGLDTDAKVPLSQLPDTVGEIPDKVDKSEVGKVSGVAGLGGDGKVPMSQLPDISGGYYITITSDTGKITQEQYNSLRADKSSYVILDKGVEKDIFRFYNDLSGNLSFSSADANILMAIGEDLNYSVTRRPVETSTNKTANITASSTDVEYPSAKAVYDFVTSKVDAINTELTKLDTGTGV